MKPPSTTLPTPDAAAPAASPSTSGGRSTDDRQRVLCAVHAHSGPERHTERPPAARPSVLCAVHARFGREQHTKAWGARVVSAEHSPAAGSAVAVVHDLWDLFDRQRWDDA